MFLSQRTELLVKLHSLLEQIKSNPEDTRKKLNVFRKYKRRTCNEKWLTHLNRLELRLPEFGFVY